MEIQILMKFLKEKLNKGLKDIEFKDYNGNTLFKLSDLSLADIENDTLRLQYKNKDTFERVREGYFPMGNLSREDIEQAFEDTAREDVENMMTELKSVKKNINNITDKQMKWFANQMMEAYTGDDYWETLANLAESYFSKELKIGKFVEKEEN